MKKNPQNNLMKCPSGLEGLRCLRSRETRGCHREAEGKDVPSSRGRGQREGTGNPNPIAVTKHWTSSASKRERRAQRAHDFRAVS